MPLSARKVELGKGTGNGECEPKALERTTAVSVGTEAERCLATSTADVMNSLGSSEDGQ